MINVKYVLPPRAEFHWYYYTMSKQKKSYDKKVKLKAEETVERNKCPGIYSGKYSMQLRWVTTPTYSLCYVTDGAV